MTWKKMMPGCEIYRAILPLHHLTSVIDYISRKNCICVYCWEWKLWRQTVAAKLPFWSSQSQESSFAAISWTTPQKLYLAVKCQIHCIILLTSSNGKRCQNLVANFKSVTVTFQTKFFNRFLVRTFPAKHFQMFGCTSEIRFKLTLILCTWHVQKISCALIMRKSKRRNQEILLWMWEIPVDESTVWPDWYMGDTPLGPCSLPL